MVGAEGYEWGFGKTAIDDRMVLLSVGLVCVHRTFMRLGVGSGGQEYEVGQSNLLGQLGRRAANVIRCLRDELVCVPQERVK